MTGQCSPVMKDQRIRAIEWRDTLHLARGEVVYELMITLPWLALALTSWSLADTRHWAWAVAALGASFFFFLTGLRQVHNAFHYTLGVSRRSCHWVLWLMSPVMLSALHAVKAAHVNHHRHCLDEEDFEGVTASMHWWQALAYGPVFTVRLHYHAWRLASPRARAIIATELAAIIGMISLAMWPASPTPLRAHVVTMLVAQCCTGFFAVWTVHHDCDRHGVFARTQRGWLKNFVSYDMFYHMEHHLFPAVPTRHLPTIAERLDRVTHELRRRQVY